RSSISSMLFLIFMLFLMTGGGNEDNSITSKNQHKDALQSLKYQKSNYTAWLNGTESNFSMPSQDPTLLPLVHSLIPTPVVLDSHSSYYRNVSGFFSGPSKFHNLTALNTMSFPTSNLSESPAWLPFSKQFLEHDQVNAINAWERSGAFNWTHVRKIVVTILERRDKGTINNSTESSEDLVLLHGKVDLTTDDGSELRLQIDGIHFLTNGSFVGLAAPKGRFSDIRELPSLVPPGLHGVTAHIIARELDRRIEKLASMIEAGSFENDNSNPNDESDSPACDFSFHLQLQPSDISPFLMRELEAELDKPTGISTVRAPPLVLDGVLISKNCGILLESRDAKGMKLQKFWRKATTYAGYAFMVYLGLLVLLARQIESPAGRTPAGISRVSRWSFVAQAGADSISFIAHLTFGIFSDNKSSLSLMAPGFLACLLLVYEARYAILINQIQGPEEAAFREGLRMAGRSVDSNEADLSTAASVQSEGTMQSTNVMGAIQTRIQIEPQTQFWFLVVVSMIFFFNVIFSPVLALFTIGLIYSFLWAPQIYRSARRSLRPGLNKDYLIGSTIGRLFFALYTFGCPENVLGVDASYWVWLVVILLLVQVAIILGQDYFGPSFFLPDNWVTLSVYDYHPVLPDPDTEAPKQSLGDCAICIEPIIIHPEPPSGALGPQLLPPTTAGLRRTYAWAPCHHVFHTRCLEQWLAIKNICPQCRRALPPL
ncbi:hypothetical protein BU17DRAFT_57057, partial [Hysterangium stoloniferum]